MTDPYQQHPNPYGQQPGRYGPNPYGGQQPNQQPNPQPDPYGQPNPYGRPGPQGGQPYGPQPDPYGGQFGPAQPDAYRQPDPYPTRQYEPGQFDPYGQQGTTGRPDQYGQYQGSYSQPPGWGHGGGPPGQPPKSRMPVILLSVLAVLVIAAGVVTAVVLVNDGSSPAAQTTAQNPTQTPPAQQQSTTTRSEATTTASASTSPSAGVDDTFEAGQCATLTPEPGNRATLNETTCGGTNSDVLVAVVQDGECVKDYITFNADVGKVYCLALDAEEGACFKFDQLAKRALNCAAGTHKVVKIFEDVNDSSQCDGVQGADRRFAYPDPPRTLCLVPTP
jgi:hypothetical protein